MRYTCLSCAAQFSDWCAEAEPLPRAFCVSCGTPCVIATAPSGRRRTRSARLSDDDAADSDAVPYGLDRAQDNSAFGRVSTGDRWFPKTLRGLKAAEALEPTPRIPEVALDGAPGAQSGTESPSPLLLNAEQPGSWRRPSYDLQLETIAWLSELAHDDENVPSCAPAEHADREQEPPPPSLREEPDEQGSLDQRALPPRPRFSRASSTAPGPRTTAAPTVSRGRRFASGPIPTLLTGFVLGMLSMLGIDHARAGRANATVSVAPDGSLAVSAALDDGDLGSAATLIARGAANGTILGHELAGLRARLAFESADALWLERAALARRGQALSAEQSAAFAQRAFEAVQAARGLAQQMPLDRSARALLVNALRIYGDTAGASELAKLLPSDEAEARYALGTLALAVQPDAPATSLGDLRAAAEQSEARGRTRAALTLALLLARDRASAQRELAQLDALARPHRALPALHRLEEALAPPKVASNGAAASPPNRAKVDRAALFAFAHEQQRRLRLEDAQHIYEAVLRLRPSDAEALCGLAELALLRGDSTRAEALYGQALQQHSDYAPAWMGSADIAWQRGDQARAARLYQTVTARFPAGAYAPYAQQRAQEPPARAEAPRCDK